MEVVIPKPVSLDRHTDDQLIALAPFGVVTAIHNEDRYNDGVSWYVACASKYAHSHLWSRSWMGGPYAAAFYPCPTRAAAEALRGFLEARDQANAAAREARERAFDAELDLTENSVDSIDVDRLLGRVKP